MPMLAGGKGILAADKSSGTIKKRFDVIHLESTEERRRDYCEMLFSSGEAMSKYISNVILYDETIRQKASDDSLLTAMLKAASSIPDVKVDAGARPLAGFPDEVITKGLMDYAPSCTNITGLVPVYQVARCDCH